MVKIDMRVEATTHEELIEALVNAGPNVNSFYGEVICQTGKATDTICGQLTLDELMPKPTEPTDADEPIPEPTPVYSKDEVRAELRKVMQAQGSEAMREILSKYGGKKLDEVDEAHYPAIVADVQEALANAG